LIGLVSRKAGDEVEMFFERQAKIAQRNPAFQLLGLLGGNDPVQMASGPVGKTVDAFKSTRLLNLIRDPSKRTSIADNVHALLHRDTDALTTNLDADIPVRQIGQTVDAIKRWSQETLRLRKVPETITVYRGGAPTGGPYVSVTTDRSVAKWFADRVGGVVDEFVVRRADVIADIDGLAAGKSLRIDPSPGIWEGELIVPANRLVRGQGK